MGRTLGLQGVRKGNRVLPYYVEPSREIPTKTLISKKTELSPRLTQQAFYKMKQTVPGKILIESPTRGEDATCSSCAHCPWMAMNSLHNLIHVLETGINEIHVDEALRTKALRATRRMMDFAKSRTVKVLGHSNV